jgi:CPA2 family monovalent cation:H+ antiporter-2
MHAFPLISTLVGGFVVAFIFGIIANRLGIAPIVGYLLAGLVVGPFTPGFVADASLAHELAEVGVILLMFGVGLHFSISDLLSVRKIAMPGAIVQIVVATILGWGLAYAIGWSLGTGLMFGLTLSTASTVVLLRALEDRRLIDMPEGRIAVGWLIVEDIAMVVALVLVPTLSSAFGGAGEVTQLGALLTTVAITLSKIALFVAFMLIIGKRLIPWALDQVSKTGSRELFTLAVLAIAFGVAFGSAELFGVSFALGAFFAGLILNESELGHKAAAETLPLRDAFAVLFFVAVGMLFNPNILISQPWALIGTFLIIVIGKSLAAWLLVLMFGYPQRVGLIISASLAQIGEFSFMLAELGVTVGLLPNEGRDLILAAAILSILVNPLWFKAVDWIRLRSYSVDRSAQTPVPTSNHVVLIGHGRVGKIVNRALRDADRPIVVIEYNAKIVDEIRAEGVSVILGNAAVPGIMESANVANARLLINAIPNVFESGQIVERARALNSSIEVIVRAHSDAEVEHLKHHGAEVVIMGEREIARRMIDFATGTNNKKLA